LCRVPTDCAASLAPPPSFIRLYNNALSFCFKIRILAHTTAAHPRRRDFGANFTRLISFE